MTSNDSFFTYDALNLLHVDIDNVLSYVNADEIFIVPFKINFNCTQPFNTVLLINDFTDVLTFPSVDIHYKNDSDASHASQEILSKINCYLYSIFLSNRNSNVSKYDLNAFMNAVDFKGMHIYENRVYAFVDLTKVEISFNLINRNSLYWFALIDEIVNKNNVCNIPVSDIVTDFFMNNSEFLYFKNSKAEQIEIPSVVYTGTPEKKMHFTYTFGNKASDNSNILSSGFYFTDYTNAFREGVSSIDYKSECKGGIIRHALLLSNK